MKRDRCKKYQNDLMDYLYGALTGRRLQDLERHLETCDTCRNDYETLAGTLRTVRRAASVPEPGPRADQNILRRARQAADASKRQPRPIFFLRPVPMAAVTAVTLAIISWAVVDRFTRKGSLQDLYFDTYTQMKDETTFPSSSEPLPETDSSTIAEELKTRDIQTDSSFTTEKPAEAPSRKKVGRGINGVLSTGQTQPQSAPDDARELKEDSSSRGDTSPGIAVTRLEALGYTADSDSADQPSEGRRERENTVPRHMEELEDLEDSDPIHPESMKDKAVDRSESKEDRLYRINEPCIEAPVLIQQVFPDQDDTSTDRFLAILEIIVGKTGDVESATLLKSENPEFGIRAVTAAKLWKYQPATCDGTPVRVVMVVTMMSRSN